MTSISRAMGADKGRGGHGEAGIGGDPVWLAMLTTVNLQTSLLTPPFGWALLFLRGVTPPG